jgi:hypothetical protein
MTAMDLPDFAQISNLLSLGAGAAQCDINHTESYSSKRLSRHGRRGLA